MNTPKLHAFTRFELLFVIVIIAVLLILVFGSWKRPSGPHTPLTASLSNLKQIGIALKQYSNDHDGAYPPHIKPGDTKAEPANSNAIFESLMPRYMADKKVFGNRLSAYCKAPAVSATADNQYKLLNFENDWCYVTNLNDQSDSRWPLVMTALAPGTNHYVKDVTQKGGVWKGEEAIILNADASASKVKTTKGPNGFPIVGRPDKPTENRFAPAPGWIESSTILYPMP